MECWRESLVFCKVPSPPRVMSREWAVGFSVLGPVQSFLPLWIWVVALGQKSALGGTDSLLSHETRWSLRSMGEGARRTSCCVSPFLTSSCPLLSPGLEQNLSSLLYPAAHLCCSRCLTGWAMRGLLPSLAFLGPLSYQPVLFPVAVFHPSPSGFVGMLLHQLQASAGAWARDRS